MADLERVCVFCGSSPGSDPAYVESGRRLGALLARRRIGLVYGGGRIGIMGALADAVLEAGGEVIGVIPKALATKEVAHRGLTRLHVVASMHERKAMMAELSDAFVALPGGLGTLEELFEVATWSQLGLHRKPIGLLDVNGYYDHLLAFLDHAVRERFVSAEHRAIIRTARDAEALIEGLRTPPPGPSAKWIDSTQT